MGETVLKKVDYDLGAIVEQVEWGEFRLPDTGRGL